MRSEPVFEWLAADIPESRAESLADSFLGWDKVYFTVNGEPAAAGLMNGQEIHFVVAPGWRRRLIRRDRVAAFLGPLLERHGGMLTTRLLHGAAGPTEFVKRMGFEKTWSDASFDYYALFKIPFTR